MNEIVKNITFWRMQIIRAKVESYRNILRSNFVQCIRRDYITTHWTRMQQTSKRPVRIWFDCINNTSMTFVFTASFNSFGFRLVSDRHFGHSIRMTI